MKKIIAFISALVCMLIFLTSCLGTEEFVPAAYAPDTQQAAYMPIAPLPDDLNDATNDISFFDQFPYYVTFEEFVLHGPMHCENSIPFEIEGCCFLYLNGLPWCHNHAWSFHEAIGILATSLEITNEDYFIWFRPLREKQNDLHGECYLNIVSFIEHFNIPRYIFQQALDENPGINHFNHINLDVIYSGDWDLINTYYHVDNWDEHVRLGQEREIEFHLVNIYALQQIVNDNVSGRFSSHFHDIWSFAQHYQFRGGGGAQVYMWMRPLVAAGLYDEVNMANFFVDKIGRAHV